MYFSLQVIQKQAVGQIWSMGQSLSTPNVRGHFKDYGFYFVWDGEPLENFKKRNNKIWLIFFQCHYDFYVEIHSTEGKGGSKETS